MELYDREKIGGWLQANHPKEYGPCSRIRLQAEEGAKGELLASVLSWPADLYQPTPEEVAKFSPPPKVEVDLAANLTAALGAALAPGKLGTATTGAKASAALEGVEALAEQQRALIAALKAAGIPGI